MTAHFPPNASPSGHPTAPGTPSRFPQTPPPPAQMSTAPAPAIALHGLTRSYAVPGRSDAVVHALAGVDLELAAGSFTAVVGASGSGKSTLLQCVAGLDRPSSGTVHLLGTQTTSLRPGALATFRAKHMGVIFQEDNLVTCLNARDNVALPGRLRQRALPHREVDDALARVGLADHASHLPAQLSGGERQRVAIARVLASRPQIVFADEPTASLDLASADTVLNWFAQIAAEGATLLMVTHDPQAAARAGSVLVMDSGRIAAHVPGGSAEAVSRAILEIRGRAAA